MELGLSPPGQLHIDVSGTQQQQSWLDWIETLSTYFTAVGITDGKRQKALLLYTAGEDLRKIYKTLEDTGDDYKSAVKVLTEYFTDKKNLVFERHKFRQLIQGKTESVKTYATRLLELSRTCDFDKYSTKDAVIDQIIEHCDSSKLRRKLLTETKVVTLEQIVTIASAMEAAEVQAREIENSTSSQSQVYGMKKFQYQPTSSQSSSNNAKYQSPVLHDSQPSQFQKQQWSQRSNDMQCYGCGSSRHEYKSRDCPALNKQCNYCKRLHHFQYQCNIKKSPRILVQIIFRRVKTLLLMKMQIS